MQVPENIIKIIEKSEQLSLEERMILLKWYHSFDDHEATVETTYSLTEKELEEKIRLRLLNSIQQQKTKIVWIKRSIIYQVAVAASVILIFLSGYFLYNYTLINKSSNPKFIAKNNDVHSPQKVTAKIVLDNGKEFFLDNVTNGSNIIKEDGLAIDKKMNGNIVYSANSKKTVYNTVINPRGSKVVSLQLADGTIVWLNSGSSLRFPVSFKNLEKRDVELMGEGYFEVAKNSTHPFTVKAGNTQVEVLGTHFNVNAFTEEDDIQTTLLEGKVKVVTNHNIDFLSPGQQSQIGKTGNVKIVNNVNLKSVMAWKEGYFYFDNDDIYSVMRQIARWYNIEVAYNGTIKKHFGGIIARKESLSTMMKILNETGEMNFSIEGNKIIISPKN